MGAAFVALTLYEWSGKSFTLTTSAYSSIYFVLIGAHLTHLSLGLLALAFVLAWSMLGYVKSVGDEQHRTLATLYWHFVDAVWLFVLFTVYLSPRLT